MIKPWRIFVKVPRKSIRIFAVSTIRNNAQHWKLYACFTRQIVYSSFVLFPILVTPMSAHISIRCFVVPSSVVAMSPRLITLFSLLYLNICYQHKIWKFCQWNRIPQALPYFARFLTHWGRGKMTKIFQTTFSIYFLEWKCMNFD